MRRGSLALGVLATAILADRLGLAVPAGRPGAHAAAPARCPATPIRTAPFPGLPGLRWVQAAPAAAGITGHLFYGRGAHRAAAELHTGGRMPDGGSTKILWLVRRGGAGTLALAGTNLTGPGRTRQVFPLAGGGVLGYGNYPSIVVVPTPGCWRFLLSSGGVAGTVTLPAVR